MDLWKNRKFKSRTSSILSICCKKLGRDDEWINTEIGWELGYRDIGKDEEAIKYFERAIELGRNDEWIWIRIADIYFDLKRYENVLKAYNKAYEFKCYIMKDKQVYVYIRLEKTLRRLGRYEEAIEKLLESRKLSLEEGEKVEVKVKWTVVKLKQSIFTSHLFFKFFY